MSSGEFFRWRAPFRTTRRSSLQKSHFECELVRAGAMRSRGSWRFMAPTAPDSSAQGRVCETLGNLKFGYSALKGRDNAVAGNAHLWRPFRARGLLSMSPRVSRTRPWADEWHAVGAQTSLRSTTKRIAPRKLCARRCCFMHTRRCRFMHARRCRFMHERRCCFIRACRQCILKKSVAARAVSPKPPRILRDDRGGFGETALPKTATLLFKML